MNTSNWKKWAKRLSDLSDFAACVQRDASRRGFTEAKRPAVFGDDSAWIWKTATELFPQATQIFDRFHAKEHLSQVGKIIYGDRPEGKPWIQVRPSWFDLTLEALFL